MHQFIENIFIFLFSWLKLENHPGNWDKTISDRFIYILNNDKQN